MQLERMEQMYKTEGDRLHRYNNMLRRQASCVLLDCLDKLTPLCRLTCTLIVYETNHMQVNKNCSDIRHCLKYAVSLVLP